MSVSPWLTCHWKVCVCVVIGTSPCLFLRVLEPLESTLECDCVTLQQRGRDIKSRCELLRWRKELGKVPVGEHYWRGLCPHYWLLNLRHVCAISGVLMVIMINWNCRGGSLNGDAGKYHWTQFLVRSGIVRVDLHLLFWYNSRFI